MPFSYPMSGLGAWNQPPSGGLGFGDLYRPSPRPRYPAEPDWIDDVGDLGDEDRKRLRRQAILRLAMVMGGDPGQWGQGFAAAGAQSGDFREGLIQEARGRQEEQYGRARQRADETFESERFAASEEERATKVRALISMRDQVVAADPSLRDRAEAALQAQDGAALRNLLTSLPEREAYRAMGIAPDHPLAEKIGGSFIQGDLESERRARELATLPDELRMRSQADIEEEERKRALGLGSYYTSPTELMRAGAARAPKTVELGNVYYQVGPDVDPLTGKLKLTELARAPEKAGKLQLVRDAYGYGKHGKFNPDSGEVTPVTIEEWKELKAGAKDAAIPRNAPQRRVPPPPPKGGVGASASPRPTQVTNPKNAPAGPGGAMRPAPQGLAKPRGAAQPLSPASQAVSDKLQEVQAQTGELPEDALRIAVKLLSEGKDPAEVARLVREARGY